MSASLGSNASDADIDKKIRKKDANKLGFIGLTALVFSAIVGSGVFDLPKNMSAAPAALNAQILAWITAGMGVWFIAEMFVILSDVRPNLNAGLYKYGEVGFGPFVGFFVAWGYFVCECFANVAYAVLVMSTLNFFWPGVFTGGSTWWAILGASIITWFISFLVMGGASVSSPVQKVATAIILAVMVIFIVTVAVKFNPHIFFLNSDGARSIPSVQDTVLPNIGQQLLNTMMVTLWLFGGIEGAVVMSGNARRPKDVPRATVSGYVICLVMFALVGILSLGSFTYGQLQNMNSPSTAQILKILWGPVGEVGIYLITFALLVAVFSSWISWIQMLAELPQRAAEEDHAFPKIFAERSKRNVPVNSILIATFIMQAIIIYSHFSASAYQLLLTITGTMTVAPYMVSAMYLIKIARNKEVFPNGETKHRQWAGLAIGILAFIYTVIMGYAAGIQYITISFIVYAIGIPIYAWARLEQHDKKVFHNWGEWLFMVVIICVAIAGVVVLTLNK